MAPRSALWRSGRVRAAGFPGLLIAAVAERERVTLVHYDGDYDLIAEVTGQPMQWVVTPAPCHNARSRQQRAPFTHHAC
ncbi:MAG TPA: hypothetical protein VH307_07320 [Streptosporangiaceae bacterium]|nr:hypothetical protein [Streptosporangiaceae bacterium]